MKKPSLSAQTRRRIARGVERLNLRKVRHRWRPRYLMWFSPDCLRAYRVADVNIRSAGES